MHYPALTPKQRHEANCLSDRGGIGFRVGVGPGGLRLPALAQAADVTRLT